MADSGTYTPETLARRAKMAEALLKPSGEIRHWTQGLNALAEGALGGFQLKRAETMDADARKTAMAQALAAFGGGDGQMPTVAPAQPTAPMAAPATMAQDNTVPIGTTQIADAGQPRGIRNNNPLNIEDGAFTQGQPGFVGSDGRFAKFQTPEQGIGAANALLDSYGRRGLNTPAGIVNRWAPSNDGNNVPAYASAIAKQLGIGPNDAISPEMRPQLIAAMGQHENGRPIGNVAAALQGGAGVAPGGQPPPAPTQIAQTAPVGTAGSAGGRSAAIAALLNPWTPPALSGALASQINPSYGFQTLPDGTIVRTNPKEGTVQEIYKGPKNPTWGVIGETADGGKQYGWIDPSARSKVPAGGSGIEPYNAPGGGTPATVTGPDGKPIAVPPGANAKEFVKHVTQTTADAMTGKLNETQAKSTQFANRMEDSEKNVLKFEHTAQWKTPNILRGITDPKYSPIPRGATNFAIPKEYEQFEQSKSQFITALLRQESGAAINSDEFTRYDREFFPQVGEGPDVIAQKREARRVAIEAMKKGAGPGYKPPTAAPSKGEAPNGVESKVWAAMTPEERALWK